MATLSTKREPYVEVHSSSVETGDQGLSRFSGLICAAPVRNISMGPSEPTLFQAGAYKDFLKTYTGEDKLSQKLDPTVHHVYKLLGSVSVLVLNCNSTTGSPAGSSLPSTLNSKYGEGVFISYEGYIALTDTNKNFLVDARKNIIDKKFIAKYENVDISSVEWINIYDRIHDNRGQVFSYWYDSSGILNVEIGYSTKSVVGKDTIVLGINPTSMEAEQDLSLPSPSDWNLAVIRTNPIGQTISNDHYANLGFEVESNEDKTTYRSIKVKVYGEVDPVTGTESETENEVKIVNKKITEVVGSGLTHDFIVSPVCDESSITPSGKLTDSHNLITASSSPTVKPSDVSNVVAAFTDLKDYDGGYRIDFITDSGISDPGLQFVMNDVATFIKALSVPSMKGLSPEEMSTFCKQSGVSSGWTHRVAPYRIQNFGGYTVPISVAVNYIECVARNKSNLIEFAPVFNFNNAYVADGILTRDYTKTEREQLLGMRVNTVKRDRFRGISYINDNFTSDPSNTLFNEEQIIRMANRLSWDIDYLMDQFLGSLDVADTAFAVKRVINNYFDTTMGSQRYSPEKLEVICDESNNQFGDGELKVVVNIYVGRALKKIEVFNKFLPLSAMG